MDYTEQVIAYHIKKQELTTDDVSCYDYRDWVDMICDTQDINDYVKKYVDFAEMFRYDDSITIYVRDYDGTIQDLADWIEEDSCAWKGRWKEYINSAPRDNLFIVQ
jgi:hypothetical protein